MKIFPDEEFSEESDKIFLFFYHDSLFNAQILRWESIWKGTNKWMAVNNFKFKGGHFLQRGVK